MRYWSRASFFALGLSFLAACLIFISCSSGPEPDGGGGGTDPGTEESPGEEPAPAVEDEVPLPPEETGDFRVPNFVGISPSEALFRALDAGLSGLSLTYRVEEGAKAPRVTAQDPAPGSWAAKGDTANLTVAVPKSDKVKVPELAGLDLGAARTAIEAVGLVLGRVTYRTGESDGDGEGDGEEAAPGDGEITPPKDGAGEEKPADGAGEEKPADGAGEEKPADGAGEEKPADGAGEEKPADGAGEEKPADGAGDETPPADAEPPAEELPPSKPEVTEQMPGAGTEAFPGTLVDIEITLPPGHRMIVPDLTGLGQYQALALLHHSGFVVGGFSWMVEEDKPQGSVVSQMPSADMEVVPGSEVLVDLACKSRQVMVPDLSGKTLAVAVATLQGLRLEVGQVTPVRGRTDQMESVAAQTPASGAAVEIGDAVSLSVVRGEAKRPLSVLAANMELDAGKAFTIDGGASRAFGNRSIVAYIWTPSGAQSWTGKEPGLGVDGLAAGVYEYSLVVKDSLGLLSDAVTVTLTVVEEVVAVPDLAGMTEDEAKKALEDAGLVAGAATQEASEEVAGSVTRTEPEAGMGVAPGSTVEIWVAAEATVETPGEETPGEETPGEETPGEETPGEETPGEETPGEETPGEETPGEETPGEETPGEETPGEETPGEETPGEETPAGKVEVPDVGGVSLAQARKAIEKAGLKVGQVTLKPGEGTPGQVISQTPFAGAEVDRGASVELDVGAEKKILVPDVKGLSRPQAAMRIRAAGLRYKVTYKEEEGTNDRVIETRPAAGVEVKAGTQVVLLVRRALVLVIVPSIDGLVRSMAEKRLAGAGLVLGRVEEKVEKGGGGLVFHQNPASGTKVKKGSSVDVKIKVEPAPVDVKVPDVRGLKLSEAGRILTEAGLRVGITPFEKTNEHKPGLVIRQSPAPGATAKSGSDVRLIIAQAAPDLVPVPDLQGKTLEEARKVLEKEGLALGVVTRAISSEGKPEGTVLKQSPMVGREVPKGSKVHLVVASKTPTKVKVPKLLGLTLVEATKALAAAGLKLGSVNYEEATGRPKDQVTSQSSDPKTEVVPGTVVSIAISRGKVERVRVPVLLRKSAKEAEEILKKLGLVLGKVEEGPRYGKEIVVGQTPAPMKSVLKGSRVDIIVTTRK